jgi:dienelactone hydrolase
MRVILVSDVFGLTPALLEMSNILEVSLIVDPYNGNIMDFKNETEAYTYFINTIGLDNYLTHLINALDKVEEPTTLIGFSVGASAIWRLSGLKRNHFINKAFCFYGSQIRNFTQIDPSFPIDLIFPISEPHFDVSVLSDYLAKKIKVNSQQSLYLHGFMNFHSKNYSKIGYEEQLRHLSSQSTKK